MPSVFSVTFNGCGADGGRTTKVKDRWVGGWHLRAAAHISHGCGSQVSSAPGLPVPAVVTCAEPAPARPGRGRLRAASSPLRGGGSNRPGAAAQPTVPRHRRFPGGETIDTAACTAPPTLPRDTCVSQRGQELNLVPEPGEAKAAGAAIKIDNF